MSLSSPVLDGLTGHDGRCTIAGAPAGTYVLRVRRIGQEPRGA